EGFFAEFRNADGSAARGYETYRTPEEFAARAEAAVRRLIPIILQKRRQGAGPAGKPAGQCPRCGHVHSDWQQRRGCERCDAVIRDPCVRCGTLAGVWSKFCGGCRADLGQSLRQMKRELEGRQQEIMRQIEDDQIEAALARVTRTRIPDHSALLP